VVMRHHLIENPFYQRSEIPLGRNLSLFGGDETPLDRKTLCFQLRT